MPAYSAITTDSLPTINENEWVESSKLFADTLVNAPAEGVKTDEHSQITITPWSPNPMRAVWLGAILPGAGQIYNRSYWKMPIVYGGFAGCAYAIVLNNTYYQDYKEAYRDILTDETLSTDPTRSYNAILPLGYTIERMGGRSTYTSTLNNQQNTYRRYRDISIVACVVWYALTLIDAYVDAQLFDYDISTDLSINLSPELQQDLRGNRSAELHVAINF